MGDKQQKNKDEEREKEEREQVDAEKEESEENEKEETADVSKEGNTENKDNETPAGAEDTNKKTDEGDDEERMKEGLREIYAENDGEMPDLTHLDQTQGSPLTRFLLWLIAGLSIIALVAWGGFLFWSEMLTTEQKTITATIDGPESVRAGEPVFYDIYFENTGDVSIAALEMELNTPDSFHVTERLPQAGEDNVWTLGNLSPGSDGKVSVEGVFRSEIPSSESLQAFFTYRPANVSSDFQSVASKTVGVEESVIQTTVDGPDKTVPGDQVEYIIQIQNNGSAALDNMHVTTSLPEDFNISTLTPEPMEPDVTRWTVASLDVGAIETITIDGQYTSSAEGAQQISAKTDFLENDGALANNQSSDDVITDILGGNFAFNLIVDGSSEEQTAKIGETLRTSINYANDGDEVIEDVRLQIDMTSEDDKTIPIDWENAQLDRGVRDGDTISWGPEEIEDFIRLEPETSGVIDLTLPLIDDLNPTEYGDDFTMNLSAQTGQIGSVASERTIETTPIAININSDMSADARVAYYDENDEPIGSGPIPPTVGETTTYRIKWQIENSLHPLENITMSTNLPPDVNWTGTTSSDIGNVAFDETTRLVTWQIDSLPTDINNVATSYDVTITPEESDVGAFFKLTNATSIEAIDTVTEDRLSQALDVLTTDIEEGEQTEGTGVVAEADEE
jgi:uncharacterized repeat protein (TIGR01451 family)